MKKGYLAFMLVAAVALYLFCQPGVQVPKAVLSGQITWTVEPGAEVEQGSELVRIRSLTGGEIAAARADGRGVVREVSVHSGESLTKGQTVAKIELTKK